MDEKFNQYDVFVLAKDINPVVKKGMQGVILEKYSDNAFIVEFVKPDRTNFEFDGEAIFTLDKSYFG